MTFCLFLPTIFSSVHIVAYVVVVEDAYVLVVANTIVAFEVLLLIFGWQVFTFDNHTLTSVKFQTVSH